MIPLRQRILFLAVIGCLAGSGFADNRDYTYIYFENGYPTALKTRQSQDYANRTARANPDLIVQTGFYSLRLDCDDVQLTGYDALDGSDYLTALNEDVTVFSPAELTLSFRLGETVYTCVSATIQEEREQFIRLIESGQYVQRFDHMGLIFVSQTGERLEKTGRLEITAWPEHVTFKLDLSGVPDVQDIEIVLISPAGKTHRAVSNGSSAALTLQPHLDRSYEDPSCSVSGVDTEWDADEAAIRLDLPMKKVRFPADTNRLDEFVIELKNSSSQPASVPVIFSEPEAQAITGTSMVLCEEDGRPTGIPVQVSKNWHNKENARIVHDGPWLRGYTMVPLAGGETKRLRLKVVTGYWGGVPAVSFSQLCLIGYWGHWKWDQSALGCWGESMCYDPAKHLASAFITDTRPAFTPGFINKKYEWTENSGGGDFLIYVDRNHAFHHAKKLKTAYHWTGPNMTEVIYSGMTDDEKIRFNYRIRSVRTADVHRRFHAYEYRFLKTVRSPDRLVFHQMASDFYRYVEFDRFYLGDASGLLSTRQPAADQAGYFGTPFAFNQRWVAMDDTRVERGQIKANRGILSLSSELNGEPLASSLHLYSPKGRHTLFDLSADRRDRSYSADDIVSGELEFIMPPKRAANYWGADQEFSGRLKTYGTNTWRAVADEYRHNVELKPEAHTGELIQNYPIEMVAAPGAVLADITIPHGGIGHIPIILRGVPADCAVRAERYLDGVWVSAGAEGVYQGRANEDGSLDCVFNMTRPNSDLSAGWRIRFCK
jgi:hypothetical protein